jgi:hypothetical protein
MQVVVVEVKMERLADLAELVAVVLVDMVQDQ